MKRTPRPALSRDARVLIVVQGLRAAGYGFTAVVLGVLLADRGYSPFQAGLVLTALIGGTAIASLLVGRLADRIGLRRSYGWFFIALALAGAVVASGAPFWVLFVVALTGTLSTDVVDNGPATTLEQVMLASEDSGTAVVYGWYNATGAAAGALGALAAVVPGLVGAGHPAVSAVWFAALIPVGVAGGLLSLLLSPAVEGTPSTPPGAPGRRPVSRLGPSRRVVRRLAALFAVDAAGGGLVTTGFLAYFLSQRYGASLTELGGLFFAISIVQAASVVVAPVLARRFGLIATMVATHLPSNLILITVAFAPTFSLAVVLLLVRTTLSQMDVPTRQALVMTVVTPGERTAAAAVTNASRYIVRPLGPLLAGAVQQLALGAPLVLAGLIKAGYDLALWEWARHLPQLANSANSAPTASTKEET